MKRELRTTLSQLTPDNRRTLRRMARYIDSYALNEVAYEELMNDLVGMALECQKRQEAFSTAVGMDEAAFCHELVVNCPRKTAGERVLSMVEWLLLWLAAVLPALWLLECVFRWMPGECDGLLYLSPASFICKYFATVFMVAGGLFFLKRSTYWSKPMVGGGYLLVFLLVFITVSEVAPMLVGDAVWKISIPLWLLIFTVLVAACYAARRCIAMTVAYQRKKQELRESNKFTKSK